MDHVLSTINFIDPFIQFTLEIENNNQLAFLDVLITRFDDYFTTTVFRKSFADSLPPYNLSPHHPKQKRADFCTYVHRAVNICSTDYLLQNELNYIKAVAIDQGYSPK